MRRALSLFATLSFTAMAGSSSIVTIQNGTVGYCATEIGGMLLTSVFFSVALICLGSGKLYFSASHSLNYHS
jgi:hypothetical protein